MVDESISSHGPVHEVYNASARVADNIINYFQIAIWAMENNDLKLWWINLDKVYLEVDWCLKDKDREKLQGLWKKINPNLKFSYGLLKEYHLELRRLCIRFFTMGETKSGPAIWRR